MAVIPLGRSPDLGANPKGATPNCATSPAHCWSKCRRSPSHRRRHLFYERRVNCENIGWRKWHRAPHSRDTGDVAITPSSAAASAANFFRSVIQWLQVGYPDGVPGPDRGALLEVLRSSPLLSEEEITEVVDSIDEEELSNDSVDRDVIADFISDMTHYDAGPENIARVAARLAAAGWPLFRISEHGDDADTTAASGANSQSAYVVD